VGNESCISPPAFATFCRTAHSVLFFVSFGDDISVFVVVILLPCDISPKHGQGCLLLFSIAVWPKHFQCSMWLNDGLRWWPISPCTLRAGIECAGEKTALLGFHLRVAIGNVKLVQAPTEMT